MANYTVADLKNELTGVLHGQNLNQVVGLDVLIDRAARKLLMDCDPIETIRIQQLTSPLFDRVYDYPLPEDVKGDRIIDIAPQVNRTINDRFAQAYNEPFDAYKYLTGNAMPNFTIQFDSAMKFIRIAKDQTTATLLNAADYITGDGTWVASGDASNLQLDQLQYVYGSGSLSFDIAASGSAAVLSINDMEAVDLTNQWEQGSQFLWAYFPTASIIDSITLRWGSSTGDYWERTVTTTQFGNAFQDGWNLLQFAWHNATEVGTPDYTNITYVKYTVNYDGTEDFRLRLNEITSQLGNIYNIVYYSKYLFRDSDTGAFQEKVTEDSNIINLDVDSYNVLFNCVAYLCAQQVQGADSSFDSQFFKNEYDESLRRYVAKIRSQIIKPQQSYYTVPNISKPIRTRYSSS